MIGSFAATPVPQPVAAPGPKKTEGFAFAVRKAKRAVEKVAELIQSKGDTVNRGSTLFPNKISVQVMPSAKVATKLRESVVSTWNNRLISDKLFLRSTENILLLQEVMTRNMVYCPQLASLCHSVKLKSLESYELSRMYPPFFRNKYTFFKAKGRSSRNIAHKVRGSWFLVLFSMKYEFSQCVTFGLSSLHSKPLSLSPLRT